MAPAPACAALLCTCLVAVAAKSTSPAPVALIFESHRYVNDVVHTFDGLLPQGSIDIRQCSQTNCSTQDVSSNVIAVVGRAPSELLPTLPRLRLVQSSSYMYPNLTTVPARATVANVVTDWRDNWGVEPIAEFTIAAAFQWQYRLQEKSQMFSECAWAADAPKQCPPSSFITRHDTLMTKTLGVLGIGAIGHAVAKRAVALGMRTIATKRTPPFKSDLPLAWIGDDNDKLLRESDFIAVTVPGSVKNIINSTSLSLMKPGAVVIPVAANPVDFEALRLHIAAKRVGAVIDVWDEGCWHYPDYFCGAPYGEPSFPHRMPMDSSNSLVLPGLAMRDGRFWEQSARFVAANLAHVITCGKEPCDQLKGVVRNGTTTVVV